MVPKTHVFVTSLPPRLIFFSSFPFSPPLFLSIVLAFAVYQCLLLTHRLPLSLFCFPSLQIPLHDCSWIVLVPALSTMIVMQISPLHNYINIFVFIIIIIIVVVHSHVTFIFSCTISFTSWIYTTIVFVVSFFLCSSVSPQPLSCSLIQSRPLSLSLSTKLILPLFSSLSLPFCSLSLCFFLALSLSLSYSPSPS